MHLHPIKPICSSRVFSKIPSPMAAEVLGLFDFYWFQHLIFRNEPSPPPPATDPDHEPLQESKLSRLPTLHVRSRSDQFLSSKGSFTPDSLSPDSVLQAPKLQTVMSGKEVGEEFDDAPKKEERQRPVLDQRKVYGGRKRKGSSKSLSDLEFEELKGFMDLGFVFSEEDKNSKLVSIVPGLQRLGKKGGEDDEDEDEKIVSVSRPYLSEAWDVMDRRRKEVDPLLNWRIPDFGDEMDMKEHLRFWAHMVASAVR